ncbi:MAG: VanZ family protein [Bacteroidetes bacterium]|nr:VanZ family protein [Bacteroidota bacterium]
MRTFLKYNRWAFLWGLFIILLTSIPGQSFPKLPGLLELVHPDKLIHLFIFSVYVFLQIKGFTMQPVFPLFRRHAVLISLLIGLFLAVGTELLQACCIPMRFASIYDFIANAAGCLIGWGIAGRVKLKIKD